MKNYLKDFPEPPKPPEKPQAPPPMRFKLCREDFLTVVCFFAGMFLIVLLLALAPD